MYVTKWDGRKERFDRNKVLRTCLRLGANLSQARSVVNSIEQKIWDGIETRKIYRMIEEELGKISIEFRYKRNLRDAIASLKPKPDFELFVRKILGREFRVKGNLIIEGKCCEYEIDGVLERGGEKLMLEIKHHANPHTPTPLDVVLECFAKLLDINEKEKTFDGVMIVCNTKFSYHAKMFAECRGIKLLGWKYPEKRGLESIIWRDKLYPISFLKPLTEEELSKFTENGIVLLKELKEGDAIELSKRTGIEKERIEECRSS